MCNVNIYVHTVLLFEARPLLYIMLQQQPGLAEATVIIRLEINLIYESTVSLYFDCRMMYWIL